MSEARIRLSVSGAAEVARGLDQVRGSMASVESAAAGVRAALGSIGASLSVAAMAAFVKQTVDGIDALNDLKDATGASIENISALEDVARRTGAGIDTVGTALIKLNQGLSNAKPGTDAAKAFSALNLNIKELKALDPAQAMLKTAQALVGFADDANKARLVQELFGKSMKEVAPLLKGLAETGKLNATVMTAQAVAAEKFNKELFGLQKNATDAARSIFAPLVESINESIERFRIGAKEGKNFYTVIRDEQLRLLGLNDGPREYADQLDKVNAQLAKGDTRILVRSSLLREQMRLQAKLNELGVFGSGGGRGSVNPDVVDPRISAPDIGGVDTAAAAAAKAAAAAAAAALKKQQDLLATLSGYTSSYTDDVQRLITMQAAGKLSQEAYNAAVNDLVNSQPGVKAVLDERTKAADAASKAGIKAYEDQVKAQDEYIQSLNASADSVAKQVQSLQDEEQASRLATAQNISLAEAIEQVELARLQETYAKLAGEGAEGRVLLVLQKEIEARRKLAGLVGAKEAREANLKGAKDAHDAWQKTTDSINQSLTDALMRGWESGKSFAENFVDTVKNMFNTMVLRPVISAIVNPVAQGITGMMGLSSAANAAGTVGDGVSAINGASMLSNMAGWLTDFKLASTNAVYELGGTLTKIGAEKLGSMVTANATSIGQFATYAGYAMNAISALDAASRGKWGSAIGTGLGAAFFGPLGGAIGGAVGGWVDNAFGGGSEYTTGTGISGTFSGSGFAGRNYQDWRNDGSSGLFGIGGSGSSSGSNYSAMASAQTKALGLAFAGIKTQTAGFAQALGLSADTVQAYSKSIRLSLGSDAEANQAAIAAMFKGIADEAAAQVLDAQYLREGEAAADTLARLATSLTLVNGSFDTLGKSLLAISQAGGDVASALVDQMGGLQQFQSSMQSYYQTYYTEEERLAKVREQTTASFAALGIAMPDTLQAFRDLVTMQDVSAESGRRAYASLIGLSGAFASITSSVDLITPALVAAANSIKTLVASITSERGAVAGAASSINPSPVMSLAAILGGISGINTAAPGYIEPSRTALDAATGSAATAEARRAAAALTVNAKVASLSAADAAKASTIAYYKQKAGQFQNMASGYGVTANYSGYDNAAYGYNAATNSLNPWNSVGYTNTTSSSLWGSLTGGNTSTSGLANATAFKVAAYGGTGQRDASGGLVATAGSLVQILVGGNAALSSAATAVVGAQTALTSAQATLSTATAAKTAADVAAATAARVYTASVEAATLQYAQAVDAWAVEASKSVPMLTKLREETLRYYESQKALAEQMAASAGNLRQAVASSKTTQLDSAQLMRQRQGEFGANYSLALSTTGSVQAAYADKLASALPDLASGLMATAKTRGEWVVATQTLYAQSERVAALLDAAAPKDYQAESLSALTAIDDTLALLDDSTRAITRAIESSGGLTAAGLRQVVTALGGTPAFASGGYHSGGLRLVGENGPELEVTGPSQIYNASQLRGLGRGGDTARLEALVERQAQQLEGMRAELRAIAIATSSTAKTLRDVTPDRTSLSTSVAA